MPPSGPETHFLPNEATFKIKSFIDAEGREYFKSVGTFKGTRRAIEVSFR